ncbi:MAG: PilZ domain-containing protein [Myxococcales bacterium]|nr:PilZ domain-containing protein [Myxococcales bacterium]
MTNYKNKRRSQRVQAVLPITWIRRGLRQDITTADVSNDGMFLLTDDTVTPGSLMQLEALVPGERPLLMFVSARFVGRTESGTGIGVQIYVVSDQDRRRWQRYYRGLLARSQPVPAVFAQAG